MGRLVRPAPFRPFGNELLQVSCTHIHSASKVFTLPAICCEILSRRDRYRRQTRSVAGRRRCDQVRTSAQDSSDLVRRKRAHGRTNSERPAPSCFLASRCIESKHRFLPERWGAGIIGPRTLKETDLEWNLGLTNPQIALTAAFTAKRDCETLGCTKSPSTKLGGG